jgi:hypothetical protein
LKPGAGSVTWIHGDAAFLREGLQIDVAVMTGNVAQVFIEDDAWLATLQELHRVIRPNGHLVFETRITEARAWTGWNRDASYRALDIEGVGRVESWVDMIEIDLPLVSFRWTYRFQSDGAVLTSDSTLRFRSREEVSRSLDVAGFDIVDVRDAPDRPGREYVFISRRR